MKKAEIKSLLKAEYPQHSYGGIHYKSSSKTAGVFGEIEIGHSGPTDCTSAGFERRSGNIENFQKFLKKHELETEVTFTETNRWSYEGVKGADYDRDCRTYYLQLSWKL